MLRIKTFIILAVLSVLLMQCKEEESMQTTDDGKNITEQISEETINALSDSLGTEHKAMIEKGVMQTAALWRESDGTPEEFKTFFRILISLGIKLNLSSFENNILKIIKENIPSAYCDHSFLIFCKVNKKKSIVDSRQSMVDSRFLTVISQH